MPPLCLLFFWRDILGDQHFDYVICSKATLAPLLAVDLVGDEPTRRRTKTSDDVKTTAAVRARFPLVRIPAQANFPPALLRQKLIADYQLARAGPLPVEMA